MSFCRWSSLDYQCDVYVFGSNRGFETHVAGRRRVVPEGTFPPPLTVGPGDPEWPQQWVDRHNAVMAIMDDDRFAWVALPEPVAGESYIDHTADECADRLERLRDDYGLIVPQDAVDALRQEAT